MSKVDKMMELVKRQQEELGHRTAVEKEAIALIRQGEYQEAKELLQSLDDSILREINNEFQSVKDEVKRSK